MIIFLYGQDTYRLNQKIKEIITRYREIHKTGLNLRYFDFSSSASASPAKGFLDFNDEFKQTSMFKEKKLIILKNIFSNQAFKEKFLNNIQDFIDSEDIILISETSKISARNSLFKTLKKKASYQEFQQLDNLELKNWVKKEFKEYQVKIKPEALEKLIEFIGNDLWRFSNEIKKLVSYKKEEREVTKRDVELLVRTKIEPDIFKTIDYMASKKRKEALELLHKHLDKGDSPLYLLSMIHYQFRNLLSIKDLIARGQSPYFFGKKAGVHPYVIKKSYSLSQKFTIEELKKIYQKIFKIDLDIKAGKIEPKAALDLLISSI